MVIERVDSGHSPPAYTRQVTVPRLQYRPSKLSLTRGNSRRHPVTHGSSQASLPSLNQVLLQCMAKHLRPEQHLDLRLHRHVLATARGHPPEQTMVHKVLPHEQHLAIKHHLHDPRLLVKQVPTELDMLLKVLLPEVHMAFLSLTMDLRPAMDPHRPVMDPPRAVMDPPRAVMDPPRTTTDLRAAMDHLKCHRSPTCQQRGRVMVVEEVVVYQGTCQRAV